MTDFLREIVGRGRSPLPLHRIVWNQDLFHSLPLSSSSSSSSSRKGYEIRHYDKYFVAEHVSTFSAIKGIFSSRFLSSLYIRLYIRLYSICSICSIYSSYSFDLPLFLSTSLYSYLTFR